MAQPPPDAGKKQPLPQPAMTLGGPGGNRNALNLPIDVDGREWSNGLLDCFGDCGTCLLACVCPCIIYAHNQQRLNYLATDGTPDPTHGGELFSSDCVIYGVLAYVRLSWILGTGLRTSIRERYGIKGSGLTDCCAAFLCCACQLTQGSRELELEEQSFGASPPGPADA